MKKLISCTLLLVILSLAWPARASAQTGVILCQSSKWSVDELDGVVRIFHKAGTQYPQYGALHLKDSYFRLNYGLGSGWGTSVILMPSFWSGGVYYQGAPVTASCKIVDTLLVLKIQGTIAGLTVTEKITVRHPTSGAIRARVTASVTGTVPLDAKPGEAFKPVMLSSMHISDTEWDTRKACAANRCFSIPVSDWIIPPTQVVNARAFRLLGGTSDWKTNAPTILISDLNAARRITGQVTDLSDPNEDNVGFWAAANKVLRSWSYTITARRP